MPALALFRQLRSNLHHAASASGRLQGVLCNIRRRLAVSIPLGVPPARQSVGQDGRTEDGHPVAAWRCSGSADCTDWKGMLHVARLVRSQPWCVVRMPDFVDRPHPRRNIDISDVQCIKYSVSKAMGLGLGEQWCWLVFKSSILTCHIARHSGRWGYRQGGQAKEADSSNADCHVDAQIPQILKVLRSGSARGLSLASYLLDTAGLLITVAYNARQHYPFSTYGENAFLSVQNVIIV